MPHPAALDGVQLIMASPDPFSDVIQDAIGTAQLNLDQYTNDQGLPILLLESFLFGQLIAVWLRETLADRCI